MAKGPHVTIGIRRFGRIQRALPGACVLAALTGCVGFDPSESFESVDPAGRMNAAGKAAAQGDQSAVPKLVEMLGSDDPAERLVAIGVLERLTGERKGYDPAAAPSLRRAAIERWHASMATDGGRGNDPATVSTPSRPSHSSPRPPRTAR